MAAYSGYRQPDSRHSQPSSSYDSTYDPRAYQHSYRDPYYQESANPRSRESSVASTDGPQQPLYNALNNAFDKSDTARDVDPDLIARITAEVKKSVLDEIKLNGVGAGGHSQPAPAPSNSYNPQSPGSTPASFPSRNMYTPPSPKYTDHLRHGSVSPDPLAHDPMFDSSGDTPTPRDYHSQSAPVDIPNDRPSRARPTATSRMSYDFTPIEKKWQLLFDSQGQPTSRLGQFLRGLAVHLIDDYEPKKSLVISPAKMLQFYNDVKIQDEIYPWSTIFGELSSSKLSKIYRELRCEYHFVQKDPSDSPSVPALTPKGFDTWMTIMIQALPETEYERLSKAVLTMPISNADDVKERFPKELPRRLFPDKGNLQAQQRCAAVLIPEGVGPLHRAPTFPPPPPKAHNSGPPPGLERERSPYATTRPGADSRVGESDEKESTPLSMPLERERKPYSSTPGAGKVYEDDLSQSTHSNASGHGHRKRAQSTASQGGWNSESHRPRTYSQARPRSPSLSNYGTKSDSNVGDMPGSYQSSSRYDAEEENRKYAKEAEMKRNDWARRQAEDDPAIGGHHRRSTAGTDSSYDSQPRTVYDDENYRSRPGSNAYDNRGYESRR